MNYKQESIVGKMHEQNKHKSLPMGVHPFLFIREIQLNQNFFVFDSSDYLAGLVDKTTEITGNFWC